MARVVTRNPLWPRQAAKGRPRKIVAPRQAPSVTTSSTARISATEKKTGSLPNPIPASCQTLAAGGALDGSSAQHPHRQRYLRL
jgi:hypothetical protein